jgi:hypothetical protein
VRLVGRGVFDAHDAAVVHARDAIGERENAQCTAYSVMRTLHELAQAQVKSLKL